MFTKVRDFIPPNEINKEFKTVYKFYKYSDNIPVMDIIDMIRDSGLSISLINVKMNDDHGFSGASLSIDDFYELYPQFDYKIETVSLNFNNFDGHIKIYDDSHELSLTFNNVKEVPPLEIDDIIKEKKMNF